MIDCVHSNQSCFQWKTPFNGICIEKLLRHQMKLLVVAQKACAFCKQIHHFLGWMTQNWFSVPNPCPNSAQIEISYLPKWRESAMVSQPLLHCSVINIVSWTGVIWHRLTFKTRPPWDGYIPTTAITMLGSIIIWDKFSVFISISIFNNNNNI